LANLNDTMSQLQQDLVDLRETVEPVVKKFYRVTLETTKIHYALGELAEITAHITDLQGNPLPLTLTTRPWVDFVTSWGQLKPDPKFDSRGGVGDRAVSVRTDLRGVARVRLQAEHIDEIDDNDEQEVAALMKVEINGSPLSDIIVRAEAPQGTEVEKAFQELTKAYDQGININNLQVVGSVRNYVDAYYIKNAPLITGRFVKPVFRNRWRDYRSTILAFVKDDSNPLTPDQSRGSSSIQVTHRDWIRSWLSNDYFVLKDTLLDNITASLNNKITDTLGESINNVKTEVTEFVSNTGLVGKQRNYRIVHEALDRLTLTTPPPFLNTLTRSVQDAISIQHTLENAQGATVGLPNRNVAFEVFTNVSSSTDIDLETLRREKDIDVEALRNDFAEITKQLSQARSDISAFQKEINGVKVNVGSLGGRLDVTLAEGGQLHTLQAQLQTVSDRVNILNTFDVIDVQSKLAQITTLARQFESTSADLAVVKNQVNLIRGG